MQGDPPFAVDHMNLAMVPSGITGQKMAEHFVRGLASAKQLYSVDSIEGIY
jgi:hypothetical protein